MLKIKKSKNDLIFHIIKKILNVRHSSERSCILKDRENLNIGDFNSRFSEAFLIILLSDSDSLRDLSAFNKVSL